MAGKNIPTFEEIRELFHEVTEQFKDTDAKFKDTDAKFKDTDAKFKQTDAKFKQTDAKIDKLGRNIGGFSKKWGDLGEAMTVGECHTLFNAIEGIEVRSVYPNVVSHYQGKEWEIDGIAAGKQVAIVIEAKATLKKHDVTDFVDKTLKIFTKLEPDHEGKRIYGAMGFLSASDAVRAFAQEQGLLLLRPTETTTELVPLPKGFKLRDFHP